MTWIQFWILLAFLTTFKTLNRFNRTLFYAFLLAALVAYANQFAATH